MHVYSSTSPAGKYRRNFFPLHLQCICQISLLIEGSPKMLEGALAPNKISKQLLVTKHERWWACNAVKNARMAMGWE